MNALADPQIAPAVPHLASATRLQEALRNGEISSHGLVCALRARAEETETQVGGFSQALWPQALEEARRLDEERAAGKTRGPLHGLPITVKENIDVRGARTSVGLHKGARFASEDAVVVRVARSAGALVLGKSNVPQALISMRCDNALYGPTNHPSSPTHVTGGSSAGEGALIASGVSVFGLGTDLGGSIRFPASFCGIAGFKPTQDRWSNAGIQSALPGQEFVRAQVGALGRSAQDLKMLFRALPSSAQAPFDGRVPPLENQRAPQSIRGLRVGFFQDDGFIPAAPANRRAAREAARALETLGAEVFEFQPPHQCAMVELYIGATSSDGLRTLSRAFGEEPIPQTLRLLWRMGTSGAKLRRAASGLLGALGEARLSRTIAAAGEKSVAQLWRLTAQRDALRAEIERAWREASMDLLVCPASATSAVPKGMEHDASLIFSYFGRYNVLGMPAGVIPWDTVRASECRMSSDHRPDRVERRVAAITQRSAGMPVGVQVVGPRWADEAVLEAMCALQTIRGLRPGR